MVHVRNFEGNIVETVPEGFGITNQELRIKDQKSGEFIIHDLKLIIQEQSNNPEWSCRNSFEDRGSWQLLLLLA